MRRMGLLAIIACNGEVPPITTAMTTSATTRTGTGDTGMPTTIDCVAVPETPLSILQLDAPRGYHDVAFDNAGHLVGSDGSAMLKVTYEGAVGVLTPVMGATHGMDWLPNGDLVYSDAIGSVVRVTPQGASSLIAVGSGAYSVYGVTVGPDGMVYVATWTTIERYDPATGARVTVLNDPAVAPYVLDFSPDHRKLYVGTIWSGGAVWSLDLDANLLPVGLPTFVATVGQAPDFLHDALGVDWCGNVYIAEFYTNNLYRVAPTGEVSLLVDYTYETYGHGLEWGSGIGGWRADALYVPQPYNGNRVMEVTIGVPSRKRRGG